MKHASGHVKFKNNYNRVHVHVTGNCMEWRQDRSSQGGGYLSTDVFVDIAEETWHANLNIVDAFAPVMILLCDFCFTMVLSFNYIRLTTNNVESLVSALKSSFHVQLFERILEIPVVWHKGRATGEVLC
jgi:hypothetical protein